MSERHDELLELCAGHALGALGDEDRGRLERHLDAGCAECEQALAEFRDAALALARSAHAVAPPAALKERVLAAIQGEAVRSPWPYAVRARQPATRPDRRVAAFPVAALGWAAAAAFAAVSLFQFQTVGSLGARLDEVRAAQARLEQQLAEERVWTASMASPAARVAFMTATPDGAPGLAGWALYDAQSRRAIVVLENLEATPEHDYELWAIRGGGPRSLGVITADAGGRALVRLTGIDDPEDLAAFAVSYEAKGGSPDKTAPAGPVVLVGGLKS